MLEKKYNAKGTYFEFNGNLNRKLVIFVHGFGLNCQMWQWLPSNVYNKFDILKFDLYGHGKSINPASKPSLAMFANQIKILMRKLGYKKAILVGFSLGGMIVRKFAHMFEKNLEGLIIINSPHKRTLVQQKSIDKRVKQAENKGPQSTVNDAIKRWFSDEYILSKPKKI